MKKTVLCIVVCAIILLSIPANMILSFSSSEEMPRSYKAQIHYAVYPSTVEKNIFEKTLSEKLLLPQKTYSFESLKSTSLIGPFDMGYGTRYFGMIDALKRNHALQNCDESDFLTENYYYLIVTVEEESTLQCIDTTQEFGFTVTKVRADYSMISLEDGHFVKFEGFPARFMRGDTSDEKRKEITGFSDGLYLLETYYERTGTLYTSLGTKQKPLQAGHQYLIRLTHIAVNLRSDSGQFYYCKNVAPLYTELPVLLFDEKNFYDMNDLEENEEYLERLKSTGLYEDYEETQYTTGKNLIKTVNDLPITEYQLPELPTDEKPTTDVEPYEDRAAWLLPVLIGAGALVCVVPTAVVLIVKKRKKATVKEAPMTSPTDPPTG